MLWKTSSFGAFFRSMDICPRLEINLGERKRKKKGQICFWFVLKMHFGLSQL